MPDEEIRSVPEQAGEYGQGRLNEDGGPAGGPPAQTAPQATSPSGAARKGLESPTVHPQMGERSHDDPFRADVQRALARVEFGGERVGHALAEVLADAVMVAVDQHLFPRLFPKNTDLLADSYDNMLECFDPAHADREEHPFEPSCRGLTVVPEPTQSDWPTS